MIRLSTEYMCILFVIVPNADGVVHTVATPFVFSFRFLYRTSPCLASSAPHVVMPGFGVLFDQSIAAKQVLLK